MISTSPCSTSDYYSNSDYEFDDGFVKAAPRHHPSSKETQSFLQDEQSISHLSAPIKIQQSIRLLTMAREYTLSDEVFIRADAILHKLLLTTSINDIDESILVACLSLATKLSEYSNHPTIPLFNSKVLMANEEMICNAIDWDIDIITPINYVEVLLHHVMHCPMKDRVRELSYELIVFCLNDVRCVHLSAASIGMSCLLLTSEVLDCCEIISKEMFEKETSWIYVRQTLLDILQQ